MQTLNFSSQTKPWYKTPDGKSPYLIYLLSPLVQGQLGSTGPAGLPGQSGSKGTSQLKKKSHLPISMLISVRIFHDAAKKGHIWESS